MDCKDWENEISRREADLLDASQQKALAGHLAGCPMCRAVDDRVKQGIQAMSQMPITPAPKNFLDDSWRRIQKAAPAPVSPMQRFRQWLNGLQPSLLVPVGVAAAVIIGVTVVPALRDGGGLEPRYRILAQSGAVKVSPTPNGGGAILETQGGKLEVEHLGRAVYTLTGNGNRLQIGLGRPDNIELAAGAAEVKVQTDPSKPYAVEIAGAKVVVTGTMFKLENGNPPSVHLLEGKVKLVGPDWSKELAPGDKVAWTEAGPVGDQPATPPGAAVAPAAVPSAAASALAIPAPAVKPVAKPSPSASGAAVAPAPAHAVAVHVPAASPVAPGPGASETEAAGNQLNDPFQGR